MSVSYTGDTALQKTGLPESDQANPGAVQGKATRVTHTASSCQAPREVLSLVGDKWSVLIVMILKDGTRRFNELRHSIEGISQRMLTRTLRQLEREGLITRTVEPTVPPSVYYALTPLGLTLLAPIAALAVWAKAHYPAICKARDIFDAKNGGKAE